MKPLLRNIIAGTTALIAVGAGAWYWHHSGKSRSTDDAYVNADIVQVASRVTGQVVAVHVKEGEFVHAGQPLFVLDPEPFRVALAEAEAKLAQALQDNRADTLDVAAARATLARSEADFANARAQALRTHDLVAARFMSRQAEDDAQARLAVAQATVNESSARLARAQAQAAAIGGAAPGVKAAEAQVARARLDLEHAHVVASKDGWIANLSLVPGATVTPNQPLFSLIARGSFWVDANFKETQLSGIKAGQPVDVRIDMIPDRSFTAVVESLGGGTGSAFSLLPAQNATGNWVKVTQRLPVRVRFVGEDAALPFKVGASATVVVKIAS